MRPCPGVGRLTLVILTLLGPAAAAQPVAADLRRGYAAAGASTSEEPAVRAEREAREPSAAFLLGASLGAWRNASAQLHFDLETPSGDGDDSEAIAVDCYDDRIAFDHLAARTKAAGLTPAQVLEQAGIDQAAALDSWRTRADGAPQRCR